MEDKETKIKKAVPPTRPMMSYELQHAIIIPKGTILRQEAGKPGVFDCPVAGGKFTVDALPAMQAPATYKRVVTA